MNLAFVGHNSMTSSLQCIGGKVKLAVSTRYGKGAKKGKFAGGEGRGAATIALQQFHCNKGIGDVGSTADIRMLWSALDAA